MAIAFTSKLLLLASCEAYTLGAITTGAPARIGAVGIYMNYMRPEYKPAELHVDYAEFRFGHGNMVPRPLGGMGETACTTAATNPYPSVAPTAPSTTPPPEAGTRDPEAPIYGHSPWMPNANSNYNSRSGAMPADEFRHGHQGRFLQGGI